jgi:hypothetical protein
MRRALLLLVSGLLAGAAPLPAQEQGQWWAINGPKAIIFDNHLKKVADVDIGLNPLEPEYSPDRRYLAVPALGGYTSKVALWSGRREYWPEPGASSTITILRADTLEIVGRQTVRFRPSLLKFIDDTTLLVVSLGQVSTKADKQILPAITLLNVPGAEVRTQIDVDTPVVNMWYEETTRLVHLACGKFDKRPAAIVTFDPTSGKIRRTPFDSDVADVHHPRMQDITYIELEDGVAVVNARGDVAGAPFRAGKEKALFTPMPGGTRYLLAGHTGKNAKLLMLENGVVAKEVALERVERCVFGDKTPYVIVMGGDKGLVLDRDTLDTKGTLKLPGSYIDVILDPAERNLCVFKGGSIAVIDVAQNKEVADVGVGRGLQKLMANYGGYSYRVGPTVRGAPLVLAKPVYTMAFSPSGSHLFAYHAGAGDLTIVDTAAYTVDEKVGIGTQVLRGGMWQLPGRHQLLVFKGKTVMMFDTEEGRLLARKDFPDSLVAWDEWLDQFGMLLVRSTSGTAALRMGTLDVAKEFGPELAITPKALDDRRDGVFFFWPERRFVITTTKGARMYDYDLAPVGDLEGVTGIDNVIRVMPPVKPVPPTSASGLAPARMSARALSAR